MADVSTWSPNDAANNAAPPDGWPEGMPASAVNDTGRSTHGAVRRLAEDGGWFDWGHTYTFVDADTFQVTGTFSPTPYVVGRRVRIVQTATVYGTIVGVTEGANTVVDVALDSGVIANEAMAVSLGPNAEATGSGNLSGEIRMYGGTAAPTGWLLCDGALYDPSVYPALFAVISNAFGGDGVTTFAVPDTRGRSPIGIGNSPDGGVDNITLNQKPGTSTHTLVVSEMPSHTHTNSMVDSTIDSENSPGLDLYEPGVGGTATGSAGNDQPHNNQSPAIGLNFIIAI